MAMVRVNGVRLAYDEAGSGPPVVFVHAALADRRMWERQYRALSKKHRVIRYDWRGHGDSDDASGDFAHHEDLLGLLDALDVNDAVLVGCSMGGAHSVDVALIAPERVAGLVLVCAGLSGHRWPADMVAAARERIFSAIPPERVQRYSDHTADHVDPADVTAMAAAQLDIMLVGPDRDRSALDPAVWDQALTMCERVFEREWGGPLSEERELDPPANRRLSEVSAPTLVIAGEFDVRAIRDVSTLLAEGISGARRIDVPAGHVPPIEVPERVTTILEDFLGTLRPPVDAENR